MKKIVTYLLVMAAAAGSSCTNLDETAYGSMTSDNFIKTKENLESIVARPMGHAAWTCSILTALQELPADHWVTYTVNEQFWSGEWDRVHKHDWTWDDAFIGDGWSAIWSGIVQCNNVLDILEELPNAEELGIKSEEMIKYEWNMRMTRTWFYLRGFDMFRNMPLYKSVKFTDRNIETQITPQAMFDFIEAELKEAITVMEQKSSLGGNGKKTMLWNKAGAASLLVRLYLNSEIWTGTPRYDKCAEYAQKIIDGEYGPYAIGPTWDDPFRWNNIKSDEIIYAFESNKAYAYNHYGGNHFGVEFPYGGIWTQYFLMPADYGNPNFRFGMSPGLDVDYKEYEFEQGKPYLKFKKYPSDYRLTMYKNLDNGEREGMWLFGYIPNLLEGGNIKQIDGVTDLYLRDQAGFFHGAGPGEKIEDKRSGVKYADENSGLRFVKYPYHREPEKIFEADYAEIRLAEIYYSLAECKLRDGDAQTAGHLLNQVRKRNYPAADYPTSLYKSNGTPTGNVELTMQELLDEWGREFIGEQRRRTDLIRFGKFGDAWWDKGVTAPEKEIFPLSRKALATNKKLVQNPGYDSY